MSAWFQRWTGLELLAPGALVAGVVPALAVLALAAWRRGPALRFSPAALLDPRTLPRSWRSAALAVPPALLALGLLCGALALARPARRAALPLETKGIDLLLCLDVSSSMSGADAASGRTRLEVAKAAAARFVRRRPADRIGLLTFARWPDLRCPPTLDHEALLALLAEVEPVAADSPEDATGIGAAVARAADVLRSGGAAASRVAVLLTDGEETVATAQAPGEIAPAHAGQLASALGVRTYAVVAGSPAPGAPDDPVVRMARRTGGEAFPARDAAAVDAVYDRIDALERGAIAEPRFRLEDRFLPFLLAAIAFVVLGRLLGAGPLGTLP